MLTPTLLNNRYQWIRVLGSGGFGETFLAEDTQMPSGRRCVIKQLKPVADNPQVYQLVQERFQREAAILEELGDGNNQIPRLNAYFVENGQFYLVQEYIEGQTLTQKLQQQGILSESTVKEILTNILPVLDYVHSKGIVHRDIKPDNILIRYVGGKPVLIDFGAVKETMGTVVTASGNSSKSIVIGTPGFMPSEQTAGRPVFASDLYSLGLTAIYLLTGKIPQELGCDPATGEILWRQYALSVSPSFATVLDKAIQSHARDRYSSARQMLQALQAGVSATVISAPAGGSVQQPTVVAAPFASSPYQQGHYQHSPVTPSKAMSDWQKAVIMGGVIGACVVAGLAFFNKPQSTTVSKEKEAVVATNSSPPPATSSLGTSNNQILAQPQQNSNPAPPLSTSQAYSPSQFSPQVAQQTVSPHQNIATSKLTPTNQSIPPVTTTTGNEYFWLSERAVTDADLDGKSGYDLDIMRNSIFARSGRRFDTPGLQSYFDNKLWYHPRYTPHEFDKLKKGLSNLEQQNVAYIAAYQDRYNRRYFPKKLT